MQPLLSCDFSTVYRSTGASIRDIRFDIAPGEILGVAGESGSGKSTVALSVCALASRRGARTTGSVLFNGTNLLQLSERELRRVRGREIGWVSQSSGSALNPALRIGAHFREVWKAHRSDNNWQKDAVSVLKTLRIDASDAFFALFPGQLSVGMAQRVAIALGLLHRPKLLIADEPTSALDLATQTELLSLLQRFRDEHQLAVLFISHDVLALLAVCDRIAVLREGQIVETLPAESFMDEAQHPYTRELADALRHLIGARIPSKQLSVRSA